MVVLACALLLPAGARATAPAKPVVATQRYLVAVDVDASGKVTAAEPMPGVPAVLAPLLQKAVRQWHFHPALHNKVPQPAHTWVQVLVNITEKTDGKGRVRMRYAGNGPRLITSTVHPVYPSDELHRRHSAFLMVTGTVDTSGKLVDVVVTNRVEGDRLSYRFRVATENSARQWRFEPVRVGGTPVPTRVRLPFSYTMGGPGEMSSLSHRQRLFLENLKRQREALEASGDASGMPLTMGQVATLDGPLQPDSIEQVQVRTAP